MSSSTERVEKEWLDTVEKHDDVNETQAIEGAMAGRKLVGNCEVSLFKLLGPLQAAASGANNFLIERGLLREPPTPEVDALQEVCNVLKNTLAVLQPCHQALESAGVALLTPVNYFQNRQLARKRSSASSKRVVPDKELLQKFETFKDQMIKKACDELREEEYNRDYATNDGCPPTVYEFDARPQAAASRAPPPARTFGFGGRPHNPDDDAGTLPITYDEPDERDAKRARTEDGAGGGH